MCSFTPLSSRCMLLCLQTFWICNTLKSRAYFVLFSVFLFIFVFLPTLLISYSVADRRLPFCHKWPQKSFVGLPWPKLAKLAYFGGQNACFRGQRYQNLQNNYFVPNAPKRSMTKMYIFSNPKLTKKCKKLFCPKYPQNHLNKNSFGDVQWPKFAFFVPKLPKN